MKRRFFTVFFACMTVICLCVFLYACDNGTGASGSDTTVATTADEAGTNGNAGTTADTPSGTDVDTTAGGDHTQETKDGDTAESTAATDPEDPNVIKLTFSARSVSGAPTGSMTAEGNAFVILKPGVYELSGDLSDGQLRIRTEKSQDDSCEVKLIFNNFTASSSTTAPIYVESCDKCIIDLADGSQNRLTDAHAYVYATPNETKPNACLYSSVDLTIKGKGALEIIGNYNNGIGCKKDINIKNGNITVSAPNNVIKGGNSVTVAKATLTLNGGEDAIKTDSEKEGKGYILVKEEAHININCSDDAFQASQSITVEAGSVITLSGDCSDFNCPGIINVAEGTVTNKQ